MNDRQTTPQLDDARAPGPRGGAVVTGAGSGPGLQIAQALAARGHAVHLTDLDGGLASQAATELGPPAFASALDVRSLTACRAAAARTRRRVGSVDLWINSAMLPTAEPAWELDERARQRLLEVNLVGMINGTLAGLEAMRAADGGAVINVLPLAGLLTSPGQALVAAGSQGALAFSLGARADLERAGERTVSISCLCLGRDRIIPEGLYQLLDRPRPVLAMPPWRGTLVRASYMWPRLVPLSQRLLPGWPSDDPAAGRAKRRRRRS